LRANHEEQHVRHASCLRRQGVWTKWENVIPFDLSWENLIYGPGPRVISFLLNAQMNSVRTPDMLKLWGYVESAACKLCGAMQCTLHHILVNCQHALEQGRYTWRHDSVLMNIKHHIENILPVFNSRKPLIFAEVAKKNFHISFMREGQTKKLPTAAVRRGLLDYANDWKIQVDFKNKSTVFPPVICATSQRPDVVLWSVLSRTVILLELTCPAEEGIAAAQIRKGERYSELVKQINDTKIWKARLLTIEAGARGLIASSTYRAFRVLGFNTAQSKALVKRLSEVVVRCSYAIYLAHNTPVWTHNEDLISTNSPLSFPVTASTPNIVVLREHGIRSLYHFADRANLNSIREMVLCPREFS